MDMHEDAVVIIDATGLIMMVNQVRRGGTASMCMCGGGDGGGGVDWQRWAWGWSKCSVNLLYAHAFALYSQYNSLLSPCTFRA